jgi:hypothetical protein
VTSGLAMIELEEPAPLPPPDLLTVPPGQSAPGPDAGGRRAAGVGADGGDPDRSPTGCHHAASGSLKPCQEKCKLPVNHLCLHVPCVSIQQHDRRGSQAESSASQARTSARWYTLKRWASRHAISVVPPGTEPDVVRPIEASQTAESSAAQALRSGAGAAGSSNVSDPARPIPQRRNVLRKPSQHAKEALRARVAPAQAETDPDSARDRRAEAESVARNPARGGVYRCGHS